MAENYYDLDYTGSMVDRILDTGYDLQNQGYIFRGLASHYTGTPTERTWLIAPTGSTGFGLSSPVPPGSIGICMYNGSSWSAEMLNTLTLDTAPTTGSGNGITSGAVKTLAESITNAIGQLEQSVSDRFTSLELEDTTGSLQAEVLSITLKYVFEGEEEALTSLSILAATAEKAGLMSAADKQKLDAFVTNIRSLRIQDTTEQADQGTEITNTLKWTIGGVTEAITAFTLYAATTSKAGLMSAADKTALDTLPSLINAGYLYAGIATPSTVPSSTSAKIFYIAVEGGTYTSFGNLNVTQGINIIYKSGNAWGVAQVVGIDDEPTAISGNLVRSGGVDKQVQLAKTSIINGWLDSVDVEDKGDFFVFTTTGEYQRRTNYKSIVMAVKPGDLICFSVVPAIITLFGNSFDVNEFINYTTPKKVILIPDNCFFISVGYYVSSVSGAVCQRLKKERVVEFTSNRIENYTPNYATGELQNSQLWDCCFFYCQNALAVRYSSSTKSSDINTDSFIAFFDEDLAFISATQTKGFKICEVPDNAVYASLSIYHLQGERSGANIYIDICLSNINAIVRDGPSYLEFGRKDYSYDSMASVGMHGAGEANLCWNMDYKNGVHKYYDSRLASLWLALNSASFAFQTAPANLDDTGTNDIWALGGYLYALWCGNAGKLVVGTSMDEEKGNACFSGNRSKAGGITLAGLTDCVVEGNRVKGTKGQVYLNVYNDGEVFIARGGGEVVFGGSQGAKANTPPASATANGLKGEVRFCSDAIYVCVAENSWKKVSLTDF